MEGGDSISTFIALCLIKLSYNFYEKPNKYFLLFRFSILSALTFVVYRFSTYIAFNTSIVISMFIGVILVILATFKSSKGLAFLGFLFIWYGNVVMGNLIERLGINFDVNYIHISELTLKIITIIVFAFSMAFMHFINMLDNKESKLIGIYGSIFVILSFVSVVLEYMLFIGGVL